MSDVAPARDPGVQPERTAFGWERTAIASIGAGLILARAGASAELWVLAAVGVGQVVLSGALLAWASVRYTGVLASVDAGAQVTTPHLTRAVGLAVAAATGCALVFMIVDFIGELV